MHNLSTKKGFYALPVLVSVAAVALTAAIFLFAPLQANAATGVNWVQVDNSSSVTVAPSASVTVKVNVTTSGIFSADDWDTTRYKIGSGSWQCANTPNHSSDGTYTESFSITAPSSAGTYTLYIRAYQGSNCSGGYGSKTLSNAITVASPDHLTITNATVDSGSSTTVLPSATVSLKTYVTTWGSGQSNDWESTAYRIEGGSWLCRNHSDHNFTGNYDETWNITAPGSDGTYDVQVRAYNNDSCNSSIKSDVFTLSNAIIVDTPAYCGDGQVNQTSEQCDDGNTENGDGCSATCTIEATNPTLGNSCGLDIAMVFDGSRSIESPQYTQMQTAFTGFVDAFLPGTPTEMGVVEFASESIVRQGFTNDETTLKNEINESRVQPGGIYTNWEQGLLSASGLFPNRSNQDLIVFASDGDPNRKGDPATTGDALEAAVTAANTIKSAGIRIITLGIGGSVDANNLKAISSDDAYYSSNFDTLADTLAGIAEDLCGGTITVLKLVDGQPAADWEFTPNVTDGTSDPVSAKTDGNGQVVFTIDFEESTTVDMTETLQPGYDLTTASCTSGRQSIGTFDDVDSVDGINIGHEDIVSCTFENTTLFCGDEIVQEELNEECDWSEPLACETSDGYAGTQTCDMEEESQTMCMWNECEAEESCGDEVVNGTEECDGGDNCTDECTLIPEEASTQAEVLDPVLSVLKTAADTLVEPSDLVSYTITVSNSGKGDAVMVVATDVLPAGLTYADKDGKNTGDTEKTWTWDTLAAGEDVTFTYDALVDSNAGVDDYTNVVTVMAKNHDEVSDDALVAVHIPKVLGESTPELTIEKTVKESFVNPTGIVHYTVVVTNTSDAPAMDSVLTDVLPAGFKYAGTDGQMTATWKLGDIVPTESVTTTYEAVVLDTTLEGTYTNTAEVSADDVAPLSDTAVVEVREVQVLGAEEELPVTGAGLFVYLLSGAALLGTGMTIIRKKTK